MPSCIFWANLTPFSLQGDKQSPCRAHTERAAHLSQWRRNISALIWSHSNDVQVVDTHAVLGPRWNTHDNVGDCTHYCLGSTAWDAHVSAVLTAIVKAMDSTPATAAREVLAQSSNRLCANIVTQLDRGAASGRFGDYAQGCITAVVLLCVAAVLYCIHR